MSNLIVNFQNVSFSYRIRNASAKSLKQAWINVMKGTNSDIQVDALKNITFQVRQGEVLGVIGKNGAGKSTLLKMAAGIFQPVTGSIEITGRIAPLIELSAGFSLELTGQENIILFGVLLGNSRKEMSDNVDLIAEWTGLKASLDLPLRSYSTGMLAKLGFGVATFKQSELLIIDEVLSVGDAEFQVKSLQRIEQMIGKGEAAILVSHNLELIEEKATKVLWLENGIQMMIGDPKEVVNAYRKS